MIALLGAQEQTSLLAEISPARRKRLLEELLQIRRTGVALEDERLSSGMCSIARAISTPDGQALAAVGLTFPSSQSSLEELLAAWSQPLLETSERISEELSPRPGPTRR
jgi:DNA-binding IclR family transcriptional regulator